MRTTLVNYLVKLTFPVALVAGVLCATTAAQTPAPSPERHRTPPAKTAARVIVQNKPPAPQVVTILHTINGIKAIRMVINTEQAEALAELDKAFNLEGEVHTNVIAGLALDDGQTIAAWLPEAEAEMPPPALCAASAPASQASSDNGLQPGERSLCTNSCTASVYDQSYRARPINIQGTFSSQPISRSLRRDGKRIVVSYID